MTGHNDDRFDENLKRMLGSALDQPRPAFQERLVRDVLAEVARERRRAAAPPCWKSWLGRLQLLLQPPRFRFAGISALALGLMLMLALVLWFGGVLTHPAVGRLSCLYGLVAVQNDGRLETISQPVELRSGQRIQTQAGSRAQILLPDQSKLISEPRTALQIARLRQGPRIRLEQGTLNLEAARQPPGQAITIQAAQAQVKVLGTRLDVRLVEKPSGGRQTRVRVLSGSVELQSGGRKVRLVPGTEGIADDGQPPERRALVEEVDELIRLWNQTETVAARSGQPQGLPAIVDLTTATLWAVVRLPQTQAPDPAAFELKLKYPAFRVRAFTLDGTEIPAVGHGQNLRLDRSALAATGLTTPEHIILQIPGLDGWLQTLADGVFACRLPGTEDDPPSLIQFQLPPNAQVQSVSPAPAATRLEHDKLILTLAARMRLGPLFE